jgi:predicted Zn-dependent peptidase
MEIIEHSLLPWPLFQTTLDNGFCVFTVPMENAHLSYVEICFRSGSWQDGSHPGVAHFLEHLLYGGPDREEWHPSLKPLIYQGAKGNAATYDLFTRHHLIGPNRLSENMAACLMEMTFRPMFDSRRIEIERQTIFDECRQRQPRSERSKRYCSKLYPHILRWQKPLGGSLGSVREIDSDALLKYHEAHYVPNKACLVSVGGVDHQKMVEVAQKARMPLRKGEIEPCPDIVPKLSRCSVCEPEQPNSIKVFFKGPEDQVDRIRLEYALDLLDDVDVGLLFRRLRLKERLVYSISAQQTDFPRIVAVETSIAPLHFNYVEEVLFEEVGVIAKGESPEESFQLLVERRRIGQQASREERSKGNFADTVVSRWHENDFVDRRQAVLNVTRDDVSQAAEKYLRRDAYGCLHVFRGSDS